MAFSTRIKAVHMREKLRDLAESEFFDEYKKDSKYWRARLENCSMGDVAVFLEGRSSPGFNIHRFEILKIGKVQRSLVPEKYRKEIDTDYAFFIRCVKPMVTQKSLLED